MGKKIRDMKDELLGDEEFRREYDALDEEFTIAVQLIEAREGEPEYGAGLAHGHDAIGLGAAGTRESAAESAVAQAGMRRRWGAAGKPGW